jgi:hypothetical protein
VALTRNLGTRVELLSMDPHCHDITIGLYRRETTGRPEYLVHTYSTSAGAAERIDFLQRAIETLAGLEAHAGWLHFDCGSAHQAAVRRAFLEACKLGLSAAVAPRRLAVQDKSGRTIAAEPMAGGAYRITANGDEDGRLSKIQSVASGLRKLGEMTATDGTSDQVSFACGHAHELLVGLLLPRALNVRQTLREIEAASTRGVLVAPSGQEQ